MLRSVAFYGDFSYNGYMKYAKFIAGFIIGFGCASAFMIDYDIALDALKALVAMSAFPISMIMCWKWLPWHWLDKGLDKENG